MSIIIIIMTLILSLCVPWRCRLRKKSWKNPGTVYINSQVYEDEIAIFPSWEVFLEILDSKSVAFSSSVLE